MVRRGSFIRPVLLGTLLLASCATLQSPEPATSTKKLTNKDAGSTVVMKVGDTLEVALEGNPTTGYTWEVAPDSGALLSPRGEMQFKPDSSLIGAGGIVTLYFAAVQPGEGSLRLIYHRTFEPTVAPLKIFEINVLVNK
jgi:inhibitor of cysteine peptidase